MKVDTVGALVQTVSKELLPKCPWMAPQNIQLIDIQR